MKKRYFFMVVMVLMFSLCFCITSTVYASEFNEENITAEVNTEKEEEYNELPDSSTNEIIHIEEYTAKITEYIAAGVLGLLGTSAVAIAFRKHLKNLIESVKAALGLLKTSKDSAEEDINKIKNEADKTLASLKTVKDEMLEINKKEFEIMQNQIQLLKTVIMYMASGMKELVVNGTSESVCDLLKQSNKEVSENASEEIQ